MSEPTFFEGPGHFRKKIEEATQNFATHLLKDTRSYYTEWTFKLAIDLNLPPKVTQLALTYIEIYLATADLAPENNIETICSAALGLALSFDQSRDLAPSQISEFASVNLTAEELCYAQLEVFASLGYNCDVLTATDCLEFVVRQIQHFDDKETRRIEETCLEMYRVDHLVQKGPGFIAFAAILAFSQSHKSEFVVAQLCETARVYFQIDLTDIQQSAELLETTVSPVIEQ